MTNKIGRQGRVLNGPGGQPLPMKPLDSSPEPAPKPGKRRGKGSMRRDTAADDRPTYLGPDGTTTYWSVTSLINQAVDPEPLILWAHRQGRARKTLHEAREAARQGTSAHKLIETYWDLLKSADQAAIDEFRKGLDDEPNETFNAFDAWRCWLEATPDFEIVATEIQVVHDGLGVGGCIDCIGLWRGKPCIADWKTSRAAYPEHVAQVAAYAQLVLGGRANLAGVDVPFIGTDIGQAFIIRLPKDGGDAEPHEINRTMLNLGLRQFLGARDTVLSRLELKKMLAKHAGSTGDLGTGLAAS